MAGPDHAEEVWAGLTDVERTCLTVAYMRCRASQLCRWPDGRPWYTDPYGKLWVDTCIPAEQQQKLLARSQQQGGRWMHFLSVRTAELDAQIAAALADSSAGSQQPIRQLVILGAGTDTRAWRLRWPPGFRVYEVDSAAVLAFKSRVLSGNAGQKQQQHQGQQASLQQPDGSPAVLPGLQCDSRVEVTADANDPEELWSRLVSSGLDAGKPILWLLEGFIGYLTVTAGNRLLALLAHNSPPGSRIIMTAPPHTHRMPLTVATHHVVSRLWPSMPSALLPVVEAAVHAAWQVLVWLQLVQDSHKLHHATFEQPTQTLKRLVAAGWCDGQLLTGQAIGTKYGVEFAQPILLGRV